MTPREHFAGLFAAALIGLDNRSPESIPCLATAQADALVAELARTAVPAPPPPANSGAWPKRKGPPQ